MATLKSQLREIIREEVRRALPLNERYGYQDLSYEYTDEDGEEQEITEDEFVDWLDDLGWDQMGERALNQILGSPSEAFEEIDPIMFREDFLNWADSQGYDTDEEDEDELMDEYRDSLDSMGWDEHMVWLKDRDVARIWNKMDPIAYRVEFNTWADGEAQDRM